MRRRFTGSNVAIFIIFFGLALLDAISSGNFAVAGFWVFVGSLFVYADVASARQKQHHG